MKLIFILFALIASSFLNANNSGEVFKRYKFKSAMVFYDVKISSFDNKLNSQVRGIARLIFDHWGRVELKEEDVAEVQAGDFNDTRSRHSMQKIENGTIYSVNFDEKVIYKTRDRDLDLAIIQKLDLSNEPIEILKRSGAKIIGKDKIAGYECDVWELKDQQICLYNGIPLKITIQNAGFHSEKKAVQVILNKPIPPKEFALPNFKIVEDEDYSSNISSFVRTKDYIESIQDLKREMKARGIDLDDKNLTITPDLEKDIINILGNRYLQKQKKYLPILINELEKAKKCIRSAKSEAEANKCIEPIRKINDMLGDKTQKFDFKDLNEEKKNRAIKQIDTELNHTKITSKCAAENDKTTDVIICTEGTLKPE